jgi:hypothetical protein
MFLMSLGVDISDGPLDGCKTPSVNSGPPMKSEMPGHAAEERARRAGGVVEVVHAGGRFSRQA